MWRLLIVDDHVAFRSWARELLAHEGFTVVGEAGDGSTALRPTQQLQPEVVLLDIQLPDMDGFAVAARIGEAAEVVLTSGREAEDFGARLTSSGRGFVPKDDLCGASLMAALEGRG